MNHRTSCTFTMQQICRWVVTHSKADSNLHGDCLVISRKQCLLWILFMSQHLNPSSALLDHREVVAWLSVTAHMVLHSATSWAPVGSMQSAYVSRRLPPSSNTLTQQQIVLGHGHQQGYEGHRVGTARSAHAVPMQCPRSARTQCNNLP